MSRGPTRRHLLGAAALAALLPHAGGLRAEEGAAERGFTLLDLDEVDAQRGRTVPLRLYLPAQTEAAVAPLVLFSHGIGGSRLGYSWLGSHLARHGIASVHLQHVGSDRSLWGGNPLALIGRLQGAAREAEAQARVQDLRFALDRLLGGPLAARLDAGRIAAAGHSYGANTALLAAGAAVERNGRALELREPRLRAAIALSAPPFYGESAPQRILAGIRIPTLHVTTTEDVIRIPGYYSGSADRIALFEAIAHPQKLLAVFEGGSHSIFTDRAGPGGPLLNPQVKAATRSLALAFLRGVFDGDRSELDAWPQRHAALVARYSGQLDPT